MTRRVLSKAPWRLSGIASSRCGSLSALYKRTAPRGTPLLDVGFEFANNAVFQLHLQAAGVGWYLIIASDGSRATLLLRTCTGSTGCFVGEHRHLIVRVRQQPEELSEVHLGHHV